MDGAPPEPARASGPHAEEEWGNVVRRWSDTVSAALSDEESDEDSTLGVDVCEAMEDEEEQRRVLAVLQPAVNRLLDELHQILATAKGEPPDATELADELDAFTVLLRASNDPSSAPPALELSEQPQEQEVGPIQRPLGGCGSVTISSQSGKSVEAPSRQCRAQRVGVGSDSKIPVPRWRSMRPRRPATSLYIPPPAASACEATESGLPFSTPQKSSAAGQDDADGSANCALSTPSSADASGEMPMHRPVPGPFSSRTPIRSPVFDDVDSPGQMGVSFYPDYLSWKGLDGATTAAEFAKWRGDGAIEMEKTDDGLLVEPGDTMLVRESILRATAENQGTYAESQQPAKQWEASDSTQEAVRQQIAALTIQSRYRQWRLAYIKNSGKMLDEIVAERRSATTRARVDLLETKRQIARARIVRRQKTSAAAAIRLSELADTYCDHMKAGQEADELGQVAICTLLCSIISALTVLGFVILANRSQCHWVRDWLWTAPQVCSIRQL
eukprot:SAG31_NODE_429_length_15801_cov_6.878551_2_plen_501_part_00